MTLGRQTGEFIQSISTFITESEFDLDKILQSLLESIQELIDEEYASILLCDGEDLVIRAMTTQGKLSRLSINNSVCGQAVIKQETVFEANVTRNQLYTPIFDIPMKSKIVVPVKDGNRVIGVINVENPAIDRFNNGQQGWLRVIAGFASIAICMARSLKEKEVLGNIDKLILQNLRFKEKLNLVTQWAVDLIGAKYGTISLKHGYDHLIVRATTSQNPETVIGSRVLIDDSATGLAFKERQTIIIGDVEEEARFKRVMLDENIQSEIAVPIPPPNNDDDVVVGVLNVESPRLNAFDDTTRRILEGVSRQIAVLIQGARNKELNDALQEIWQVLATNPLEADDVYNTILTKALQLIGQEYGLLLFVHPDSLTSEATTGSERAGQEISLEDSFCGVYVVPTGESAISADIREEERVYTPFYADQKMISEMAVPIKIEDDIIGILNFESPSIDEFNEFDMEIIEKLASSAAVAMIRAMDREFEIELSHLVDELAESETEIAFWTQRAIQLTLRLLHADRGQFWRVVGDQLEFEVSEGMKELAATSKLEINNSITGLSVLQKKVIRINDMENYERKKLYKGRYRTGSELAVPLILNGQAIGVLNIETDRKHAFSMRQEEMMTEVAAIVALGYHFRLLRENQDHIMHRARGRLIQSRGFADEILMEQDYLAIEEDNSLERNQLTAEKVIDHLEKISRLTGSLINVVERTLRRPCIIPTKVTTILERLVSINERDDINIVVSYEEEQPENLVASLDPEMFEDVFGLLMDNSVKALDKTNSSREKRIEIRVREDAITSHLNIHFRDNGTGIPSGKRKSIFSGVSETGGMGLPDVVNIMYKMKGGIRLVDTNTDSPSFTEMLLWLPPSVVTSVLIGFTKESDRILPKTIYLMGGRNGPLNKIAKRITQSEQLQIRQISSLSDDLLNEIQTHPSLFILDFKSTSREIDKQLSIFSQLEELCNTLYVQDKGQPYRRRGELYISHVMPDSPLGLMHFIRKIEEDTPDGFLPYVLPKE